MRPEQLPPRSPDLMSRSDTALVVIDVQERLLPVIDQGRVVVWNISRLVRGARALGIPVVGTVQYPKGLGPLVSELAELVGPCPEKLMFSCRECSGIFEELRARGIIKLLVTGIEAHVCVQQSVLDLLADGWQVYVAVDAIGSRFAVDYQTALRRMEATGAVLTTTEAALFEWCEVAGTPEFKQISLLVREQFPEGLTSSQMFA
jgi:nicotinamidase-related amidase